MRLFSLAATYGVTDRLDMGILIPLVQVDMKLKSSARIITSPENSISAGLVATDDVEFRFDGRTGVEIAANSVRLHCIDGQRGDEALTANGVIMAPGGVALRGIIFTDERSDAGGAGGAGCIVHPGAPFDPLLVGLLGCMLAYLGWQWRRRP